MRLRKKAIVITGSTSGLGKALAEFCVQEGASVIVSGRDKKETSRVTQELRATGCAADVTKKKDVAALGSFAVETFGRIDVWINNAGLWFPHAPLEEQDSARVHTMMDVNFFGTLYGCQTACAQMQRQQDGGTIVNVLSTSALKYRPNSIGYGASKSAAMSLTKALQNDPEMQDICVIGAYPGGMRTHLFDERKPDDYDAYMDPIDVARAIIENIKREDPEKELVITKEALPKY